MHSSYLPQEHNTTEQLNEPTSKSTTATQGQVGGRPTYFKRLSITICLSCRRTLIIQAQERKQESTSDSHTKQSNKTTTEDYSTSNDKDGDNYDIDDKDL